MMPLVSLPGLASETRWRRKLSRIGGETRGGSNKSIEQEEFLSNVI
jgi:hypothetical protein